MHCKTRARSIDTQQRRYVEMLEILPVSGKSPLDLFLHVQIKYWSPPLRLSATLFDIADRRADEESYALASYK